MSSSFQDKVYSVVKNIPRGRVMTYQAVAAAVGHPGAARAVGNALNKNFNSAIPCHRVIRSDGKLGKYNRGVAAKKRMLQEEGFSSRKK